MFSLPDLAEMAEGLKPNRSGEGASGGWTSREARMQDRENSGRTKGSGVAIVHLSDGRPGLDPVKTGIHGCCLTVRPSRCGIAKRQVRVRVAADCPHP